MEVQYIVLHGNYTNDKLTITIPRPMPKPVLPSHYKYYKI